MVERHIALHGGDPAASLLALSSVDAIASSLRNGLVSSEPLGSMNSGPITRIDDASFVRTPPRHFSTGSRHRYEKLRDHARGGLGVVYVARDAELNREVALKEIQERHADHDGNRARFLLEAEVTGGLEHPGIVPVYGLGHYEDGRPFYAMRFIKGESLMEAIARFHADPALSTDLGARSLALQKLLRRFLDVCNAIAYAHHRGVLHRDLKPHNVMVGRYGETLVVDWGLAKVGHSSKAQRGVHDHDEASLAPTSSSDLALTLPGALFGTLAYMSPEQASGQHHLVGVASDVYSLGATLYTLLTGSAPFGVGEVSEIVDKVKTGNFLRPREVRAWVDPAIEAVCLKAMATRAEDRYATPRALAEDVERWIADEPVTAWREPLGVRARRWAGRNRTLVASTGSILATSVLALSFVTVFLNAAWNEAHEALAKEKAALIKEHEAKEGLRIALEEAQKATREAREAQERAVEASRNVVGFVDFFVNTFRSSDPLGIDGIGLRNGSEASKTLTARDILDRGVPLVQQKLADQPLVRATLLDTIGDVYRHMGELKKAAPLIESARAIRSGLLPPDDPDLTTSLSHEAGLNQDRGDFDRAEALYEDVLARQVKRFGAGSAEAMRVKASLGMLWLLESDVGRAQEAFLEVLEKRSPITNADAKELAIVRLGYASTLLDRGKSLQAMLQGQQAMKVLFDKTDAEQVLKAVGHFFAGRNLALMNQSRLAEIQLQECLRLAEGLLEADHPYMAFVHHEIGHVHENLGDNLKAEQSYRRTIDLLRGSVGFCYPRATIAVRSLGDLLASTGRAAEALALADELIAVRREAYGPGHAWVGEALTVSGAIAAGAGDRPRAIRTYRDALAIFRRKGGRFAASYSAALNNLANLLDHDGAFAEAEPLYRESIAIARRQYGERGFQVAVASGNLGRALLDHGRHGPETAELLETSVAIRRSTRSSDPSGLMGAIANLGLLHYRRGDFDRAESLWSEAHAMAAGDDPRHSDQRGHRAHDLACARIARGDLKGALPLLEEAIANHKRAVPLQPSVLADALDSLALVQEGVGDRSGARAAVREMIGLLDAKSPPELIRLATWAAVRTGGLDIDRATLEELAGRVLAAAPGSRGHQRAAAMALLRAGRVEDAVVRLETLTASSKGDASLDWLELAVGYRILGRFDAAERARARALAECQAHEGWEGSWVEPLLRTLLRRELEGTWLDHPDRLPDDVFAR
jgi:serine/threonine protein kinase